MERPGGMRDRKTAQRSDGVRCAVEEDRCQRLADSEAG
jgi:hypothetical protein